MQKITTFLTFKDRAEEAVQFYTSIFPDSKILSATRYGDAGPGPKGSFMVGTFRLAGQEFMALNGGPSFQFSQGISLLVNCDTQEEIDEALGARAITLDLFDRDAVARAVDGHDEDAGSAVAAALDVRPGTYNVSDDEPLTRREFADALATAAGTGPPRLPPAWLSAVGGKTVKLLSRSQRIANAKLKAATNWAPRWRSAREGLPAAARELAES